MLTDELEDEGELEALLEELPPPPVTRPVTGAKSYHGEIRAGRRHAPTPSGEAGVSWWVTKDRAALQVEAEKRAREMSASRVGRRWRPTINDAT